jgi:hypothetical protein
MTGRDRLLATLAEIGITEADYRKIEKARRLADEVNAALGARQSPLTCAVTLTSAVPRSPWPDAPPEGT